MKEKMLICLCVIIGVIILQVRTAGACYSLPDANAGNDQTVAIDKSVTFDGSRSSGEQLRYSWDFGSGASPSEGSGEDTSCTYGTAGERVVTLTVEDVWEYKDYDTCTITVVDPDISPSSKFVWDGEYSGRYTVTDDDGATAWEWTYDVSAYQPAGNSPDCNFTRPDEHSSGIYGKWYAYPDSVCYASSTCRYNILNNVTIDEEEFEAGPAGFYVRLKDPAGRTKPPDLHGQVTANNQGTWPNIWQVVSKGTLHRHDSFDYLVRIRLNPNSQFYAKIRAHENEHVNQWKSGIMKDYFTVDGYWNFDTQYGCKVKDLTAESTEALQTKLSSAYDNWDDAEDIRWPTTENLQAMERGAWAVSDQMAPHYVYEGECHGF